MPGVRRRKPTRHLWGKPPAHARMKGSESGSVNGTESGNDNGNEIGTERGSESGNDTGNGNGNDNSNDNAYDYCTALLSAISGWPIVWTRALSSPGIG